MEAYLAANQQAHQQQQQNALNTTTTSTSSGTDHHLSPSTKTSSLPHPSSTVSLTSMAADHHPHHHLQGGNIKSPSPSPLPSPVTTPTTTANSSLVTPSTITTTSTSTTTTLRRPSSIGGGSGARLASSSFTSGGGTSPGGAATSSSPLSGGKTPGGGGIGASSASLNSMVAHKYPRKVLRGPWGEMLESRMSNSVQLMNFYPLDYHDCGQNNNSNNGGGSACSSNRNSVGDPQQQQLSSGPGSLFSPNQFNYLCPPRPAALSFTDELLRQTKQQRAKLDKDSRETVGTASPTEHKPQFPSCFEVTSGSGDGDTIKTADDNQKEAPSHPHHSSTDIEESEESGEEEANRKTAKDHAASNAGTVDRGEMASTDSKGASKGAVAVVTSRPLPPTVVVTEVVSAGPSITEAIGRHLVSAHLSCENKQDTRAHIVGELYDTEKNYVEVLRTLNESYLRKYRPASEESNTRGSSSSSSHSSSHFTNLGTSNSTSTSTSASASASTTTLEHGLPQHQLRWLEFVAARLPPVMDYHGKLLEQLRRRIADWCPESTPIGDLFHSFFVNVEVLQFYESMVDHLAELSALLKAQYRALEAAAAKELAKMATAEKKIEEKGGSSSSSSSVSVDLHHSAHSSLRAAAPAADQEHRRRARRLCVALAGSGHHPRCTRQDWHLQQQ